MPSKDQPTTRPERYHNTRKKLRTAATVAVNKLAAHIEDSVKHPMLMTQINAARIILSKVVPDLKAIEHRIDPNERHSEELTFAELAARITAVPSRPAGDAAAEKGPDKVH